MHLGESAAYYVNLASRSSFHLRLFQEWFLDDIYCFKLAHRFLPPSPSYLISFMENKLVGWVGEWLLSWEKKRERERERKIGSSFIFVRNFGNKKFGQFSGRSMEKDILRNFSLSARQKLRHSRRLQRLYT